MADASADDLEAHIRAYYTDLAAVEFIVDGRNVDQELGLLAKDAARLLKRRGAANT